MTLPYPDSPGIDENIATSITRINDNLDYLDGLIGSGNIKCILSNNVNLSTKTSTQVITGVGFEPKAMMVFGCMYGSYMQSWGGATVGSLSTSVDCSYVAQTYTFGGTANEYHCLGLFTSTNTWVWASVSCFTDDGVRMNFSNINSCNGLADIMYIFFG
jgi:hypothetical protein